MNTGAEASETALKLARKWAYMKKGVPEDKAIIYSAAGCFHGRTIASISLSSDAFPREGFGPFVPGMGSWVEVPEKERRKGDEEEEGGFRIRFDHIEDLERALELHGQETAAVILEPIQGEAGECREDWSERAVVLMRLDRDYCAVGRLLASSGHLMSEAQREHLLPPSTFFH